MKKTFISALLVTSSLSTLYAQRPPSMTPGGSGGNTTINRANPTSTSPNGEEIPVFDPTNKTITFQGKTYSIMDNNLGGQFDAYLSADTMSAKGAEEYRKTIREILDMLYDTKKSNYKINHALNLLKKAAKYEGDGYLSESLANAIYSVRMTKSGVKNDHSEIKALKKEQNTLIRNISVKESRFKFDGPKSGGNQKGAGRRPGPSSNQESIEITSMKKRLIVIERNIRLIETTGMVGIAQSKIQYQSLMVQLFIQRRFEHVRIATRIYNLLYQDGDTRMRLKRGSDTEKFFSESIGVNPTVAGLDSASSEAIRKVKTLINSFKNNMKTGRIHSASERLVEAFAIGEFMPDVQLVKSEDKTKILEYVLDAKKLVKTLQANDLDEGEKLNKRLKSVAKDYNDSEAKSYISARKAASEGHAVEANLALLEMRNAGSSQERDNAKTSFKAALSVATKNWPSNPDIAKIKDNLKKIIDETVKGKDFLVQAREDFDRYVDTKSWASITKKENLARFMVFYQSDKSQDVERRTLLDKITTNKTSVIEALREAEAKAGLGMYEDAWEIIDLKLKIHKDDLELSQAKALYSGKAATFANIIEKAQEAERKSPSSAQALTMYLKAENIYPNSKYAKAGIKRIIAAKYNHTSSVDTVKLTN